MQAQQKEFSRLLEQFCGVTPEQFERVININSTKILLGKSVDAIEAKIRKARGNEPRTCLTAVNVDEYLAGSRGIFFEWGYCATPLGHAIIAWTDKGIHRLSFTDEPSKALDDLRGDWPDAEFVENEEEANDLLLRAFEQPDQPLKLWINGTDFQLKVWRALLEISAGQLASYQTIARAIGRPTASRATGAAIGANPVALIIPCHRVIKSTGELGNYRWDVKRKKLLVCKELAD